MEEEMTTHSSSLAWRNLRTEKPGRLQSVGSQSQTQLKQLVVYIALNSARYETGKELIPEELE